MRLAKEKDGTTLDDELHKFPGLNTHTQVGPVTGAAFVLTLLVLPVLGFVYIVYTVWHTLRRIGRGRDYLG